MQADLILSCDASLTTAFQQGPKVLPEPQQLAPPNLHALCGTDILHHGRLGRFPFATGTHCWSRKMSERCTGSVNSHWAQSMITRGWSKHSPFSGPVDHSCTVEMMLKASKDTNSTRCPAGSSNHCQTEAAGKKKGNERLSYVAPHQLF